mmetsp:Transcript_40677/g.122488  ORF Transcript_40677/g.122488 Transcript_40677/m.122488 type:complete len:434 (+) Transcript_40677:990-2291(+)
MGGAVRTHGGRTSGSAGRRERTAGGHTGAEGVGGDVGRAAEMSRGGPYGWRRRAGGIMTRRARNTRRRTPCQPSRQAPVRAGTARAGISRAGGGRYAHPPSTSVDAPPSRRSSAPAHEVVHVCQRRRQAARLVGREGVHGRVGHGPNRSLETLLVRARVILLGFAAQFAPVSHLPPRGRSRIGRARGGGGRSGRGGKTAPLPAPVGGRGGVLLVRVGDSPRWRVPVKFGPGRRTAPLCVRGAHAIPTVTVRHGRGRTLVGSDGIAVRRRSHRRGCAGPRRLVVVLGHIGRGDGGFHHRRTFLELPAQSIVVLVVPIGKAAFVLEDLPGPGGGGCLLAAAATAVGRLDPKDGLASLDLRTARFVIPRGGGGGGRGTAEAVGVSRPASSEGTDSRLDPTAGDLGVGRTAGVFGWGRNSLLFSMSGGDLLRLGFLR